MLLGNTVYAGFNDREEFGNWLNERELKGVAVEVGTNRAEFAGVLLATWQGRWLYGVDQWKSYNDEDITSCGDREDDRRAAELVQSRHEYRFKLLDMSGYEAAKLFADESVDFVYIDADHAYANVLADHNTWWPKVKPGGVVAGHDIVCPGEKPETNWGRTVQPAVTEFSIAVNRSINLVPERLCWPWSYYLVK